MNVQLITMDRAKAKETLEQYKAVVTENRDATYEALRHGYKALAKGLSLIDVGQAMQQMGLDHLKRPRLAICRADAAYVYCRLERDGSAVFKMEQWHNTATTRRYVLLPAGTFKDYKAYTDWKAKVPLIPPPLKPTHALSNYHILWEADWEAVPRDPILLRRLKGLLFVVLAQWDLTPLEQAILRGTMTA